MPLLNCCEREADEKDADLVEEEEEEEEEFNPELAADPSCTRRLRYELKLENLWHNGDYPNTYGRLNWVRAFGGAGNGCWCCATRPKRKHIMSPRYWLLWRFFVFSYLMSIFLFSIIDAYSQGTWFYYLTNWQTSLFAMYGTASLITCAIIQHKYWHELCETNQATSDAALGASTLIHPATNAPIVPETEYQLPWYVRVTWVLHGFAMSLGMWVTFMFWSGIPMFLKDFEATHVLDHITTMTVLTIDFSLAAFPWLLLQFAWSSMVAFAYLIWTILHYEFNLHNKFDEERYIYPVVDWSRPLPTLALIIPAMFIGIPLFSFIIWYLSSEAGPKRVVPWAVVVKSRRNSQGVLEPLISSGRSLV